MKNTPTIDLDITSTFDQALNTMTNEEKVVAELIPCVHHSPFTRFVIKQENVKENELILGKEIEHFNDHRISTKHCAFHYDKELGALFVTDTSTNGVYVNGKRLQKGVETRLNDRDEVCLVVPNSKHALASQLPTFFVHIVLPEEKELIGNKRQREEEVLDVSVRKIARKEENDEEKKHLSLFGDATSKEDSKDEIKNELICGICSDVFYKPVSMIPCLHTFCGACYSQWMEQDDRCPQCREQVRKVKKAHMIANIVEAYLKKNPELQRSKEELSDMDSKNIFTDEVLRSSSKSSSSDSYEFHDDYNSEDDEVSIVDVIRSQRCPECNVPGADGFQCAANQFHVNCSACMKLMPLRSDLPDERSQVCGICQNYFCDLYTGSGCSNRQTGALTKFEEHKGINFIPFDCLNSNSYERQILLEYMESKGLSAQGVFNQCCEKLRNGEITFSNPSRSTSTICCNLCALKLFNEVLYPYRASIPQSELPSRARGRDNCWYGRECRTQTHNAEHARKLNHICENTRKNRSVQK
jgi:E3 ubiquitin-protein ligase CHFR